MGLARSTYYDEPSGEPIEEARLVERIRRSAPSDHRTLSAGDGNLHAAANLANHKKVMRLMRETGQRRPRSVLWPLPQRRRRADFPQPGERRCAAGSTRVTTLVGVESDAKLVMPGHHQGIERRIKTIFGKSRLFEGEHGLGLLELARATLTALRAWLRSALATSAAAFVSLAVSRETTPRCTSS